MKKPGKEKKKSWFAVNKIYLFIIFIFFSTVNFGITFYGFLVFSFFFFITRRLPLEPREKFESTTYPYKTADEIQLKLDIWYPKETKESYPVVFFSHGGGWISGFRNQPGNVSWSKYLASRGFCVVSIDYRYGFTNNMEDILSDYSDALNFVRLKADDLKIDKDKIILAGLSAGGHISLLYSSFNTYTGQKEKIRGIKGVVAYYSPSELSDLFSPDSKSLFARFAALATLKGTPKKENEVYTYYSPIEWISDKMLPVLIVHGKCDNIVPFESSVKLAKKLQEFGVPFKFFVHKKGDHGFEQSRKDYQTKKILEDTVKFMKDLIA